MTPAFLRLALCYNPARMNKITSWLRHHRIVTVLLIAVALLFAVLIVLNFLPVTVDDTSVSNPATGYEDAVARVAAMQAEEEASGLINPICQSILLTHGEPVENAIIFYHGFTSCPEQFRELGQEFYERGYNVFIPLMPHHGHADRDRDALLNVSAEELAVFATKTVDIGGSLGEDVVVSGLSGGGTIGAWIAQRHESIERAVIIAPFLGIGFIPAPLNRLVAHAIDVIPNFDMWWDPRSKENNPQTADYAYPGYPLHSLAEYLRLGWATHDLARRAAPAVTSITVVLNEHDDSVSNSVALQLAAHWRQYAGEVLRTEIFPAELGLPHDLITATREDGNPALVYPIITDSIEVR